jgi:hypothetical protein
MSALTVAALYVREDSIYKTLGLDCFDINRDARTWKGGCPLIAHPPCRAWGRLSHMAKPRPDEKQLAIDAINLIRQFGGVLEHPMGSKLWVEMQLPAPGKRDIYGGFTVLIHQSWFGHKAEKKTFLYIVGTEPALIPPYPISFDAIQYVISSRIKKYSGRRVKLEVTKAEREHTPELLAAWLVKLASMCVVKPAS